MEFVTGYRFDESGDWQAFRELAITETNLQEAYLSCEFIESSIQFSASMGVKVGMC